ncbi:hypothetical protein RRG08_005688 [Elysia crispata]|uniref:Uncharacterized protein n=1 Tax=Elysia crispata TaxID=231223 RepID=A0AAE0YCM6_9GAST|nr:hypothetical protein RRG08_005688 [Elysia crispata]
MLRTEAPYRPGRLVTYLNGPKVCSLNMATLDTRAEAIVEQDIRARRSKSFRSSASQTLSVRRSLGNQRSNARSITRKHDCARGQISGRHQVTRNDSEYEMSGRHQVTRNDSEYEVRCQVVTRQHGTTLSMRSDVRPSPGNTERL